MKPKKKTTWHEEQYQTLLNAWREARGTLITKTEDVICKKGVVDLYPEGADKAIAQTECKEAQRKLICAIGNYDARKQEAEKFYKEHWEQLYGYADRLATSHYIIEVVYKKFF